MDNDYLTLLGKVKNLGGAYFCDYSPTSIPLGCVFKNGLKLVRVYDQFMTELNEIPDGWKTIVMFDGDEPIEMKQLKTIITWRVVKKKYFLWMN